MTCRRIRIQCAAVALMLLVAAAGRVAPAVTTIEDTLYKADGTPFEGLLMINWKSFEGPGATNIPTNSLTAQVTGGHLLIKLVPTTTAPTAAYYSVRYVTDGSVQFTEIWSVPPSDTPLRVRDVRIAWPPATTAIVAAATTVTIEEVEGLMEALDMRPTKGQSYMPSRVAVIGPTGQIEAAAGDLDDCVKVDGSSGPCLSGFVDAETPAGTVDGVNAAFTLAATPAPAASLRLYRNGLLQKEGVDFTLSGNTVSFLSGAVPQPGDILLAYYRTGGD